MKKICAWKRFGVFAISAAMAVGIAAPAVPALAADTTYKDGTYTGTGAGYEGEIKLSVTVKDGKISDVSVVSQNETAIYWNAARELLTEIVQKQTPEVDTVSGATRSSNGIKEAVRDALNQASETDLTKPDASIFASGEGTKESPFIIHTADQFKAFAKSVSGQVDYTGYFVKLDHDIDISGGTWDPIGGDSTAFNGTLDGDGYTINGMTIGTASQAVAPSGTHVGLFGNLGGSALIKDLNMKNVSINLNLPGMVYAGVICGSTSGIGTNHIGATLNGVNASGTLTVNNQRGNIWAGGLIGMQFYGTVINSVSDVDVTTAEKSPASLGKADGEYWVETGGISGLNFWGLTANTAVNGDISGSFEDDNDPDSMYLAVGGLTGLDLGTNVNNYVSGNVTAVQNTEDIGPFVGVAESGSEVFQNYYSENASVTNNGSKVAITDYNDFKVAQDDIGKTSAGGNTSYSSASSLTDQLNTGRSNIPSGANLAQSGISTSDLTAWKNSSLLEGPVSNDAFYLDTISQAKIAGVKDKVYNGKNQTQKVTATYAGKDVDSITISYNGDRKSIGTRSVTVSDKNGILKGTKKVSYKISPAASAITKATASGKKINIAYKAVKGGVKYQVAYRKGSGSWKTKNTSAAKLTVKAASPKKYSVRVRAYKKVSGKTYYGAWSKTVKVK